MGLKRIDERLSRVTTIINGWQNNKNVPRIERDLALEELRHIYDEILDYTPEEGDDEEQPLHSTTVVATTEVINDIVDDFDDALDIDALLGIGEEDVVEELPAVEEQTIEVPVVEEKVEQPVDDSSVELPKETERVEEQSEPQQPEEDSKEIVEQEETEVDDNTSNVPGALFNLDDIPVRSKRGRKMVHLYNDNFTPTVSAPNPIEQPAKIEEPTQPQEETYTPHVEVEEVVEQPKRLGDVLGGGVQTLADAMASADEPTTPFNRITELRKAIGLNDKFLMIRDLFDGDAERYEATIDTLDEFDDLDECMIYIVENFHWNPDLEAAKLIVSLLERKLA